MTGTTPTDESETVSANKAATADSVDLVLVYDGECPVCNYYRRMLRLRETVGQLQVINARDDSNIMREITEAGLDIDKGMVVKMHGELYFGADAMHAPSLLSSRSGLFNRLNYHLFRMPAVSRRVYPVLATGRLLLLRLLGRKPIDNLTKK